MNRITEMLIELAQSKVNLMSSHPMYGEDDKAYRKDFAYYVSRPRSKNLKALKSDEFEKAIKAVPIHIRNFILTDNRIIIKSDKTMALQAIISKPHELQVCISRVIEDVLLYEKLTSETKSNDSPA
jgi:hypothetical protein